MSQTVRFRWLPLVAASLILVSMPSIGECRIFNRAAKADAEATELPLEQIQRALDERRLVDAGRLIDQLAQLAPKHPSIRLFAGELGLQRGRYAAALADFRSAEGDPTVAARAYQGSGIALIQLGRGEEALTVLRKAVAADPVSWRAWNALGSVYDEREDWRNAAEAYDSALANSNGSALVLNNRGFSRLLQGRLTEAVADFVSALDKKPELAEARTNLRLALAMSGDYARSLAGVGEADRAALLNNAGFAAGVRGDYPEAEKLLEQALQARGEFYGRASENLKIVRGLKAQAVVK